MSSPIGAIPDDSTNQLQQTLMCSAKISESRPILTCSLHHHHPITKVCTVLCLLKFCVCGYRLNRQFLVRNNSHCLLRAAPCNPIHVVSVGAGIAQLVVLGLAVHSVAGLILLWGHFPVEGIFPLELTWVQTPFPQNSFGWEYKPRSSLCTHAFHCMDSKAPDVHVLDGWMPATKTHPVCIIHEDGMWLP